jgi:hypothetical protein
MSGTPWAAFVLAQPMAEESSRDLRGQILNEIRAVKSSSEVAASASPLAEHYEQLLEATLSQLTNAQSVGAWRTAVYLLGDSESYYRLAAAWRSIFAGEASLPEPIRVWSFTQASSLASHWALPDTPEVRGPGLYSHPFKYQTVLSSDQLAAYVHLPQLETPGFRVKVVPDFDVVPAQIDSRVAVNLGRVIQRGRPAAASYAVSRDSLAGHAFVTGITNQGKTNTVFHMLRELAGLGVKILVLEPAKSEYRGLAKDPAFPDLQVFTVGNEREWPLRVNPFEAVADNPVGVHLDLLRSVFAASFGMWTPLPQVLEQCMREIYEERGWDVARDSNNRMNDRSDPRAFPTLTDLVAKISPVVRTLGFDPEARDRILASLQTRIEALRFASRGRMLDTQYSIPMDQILGRHTIIELETVGDDDDKAFIMGLLLIRLVEHRRAAGASKELKHVLVIEEAHRLLTNVPRSANDEHADPRGKAVEAFSNLLSEIRAYGQGVIVVDQVPTKLAPDVIKNTNLKIAHRIVAGDDREILSRSMAMNDRQSRALTNLVRGQAIVFSEQDDAPILIEVEEPEKDQPREGTREDENDRSHVRESMIPNAREQQPWPTDACEGTCSRKAVESCESARRILEYADVQEAIDRLVLSVIESPSSSRTLWRDVVWRTRSRVSHGPDEAAILRCLAVRAAGWFGHRRGTQASWSYDRAGQLQSRLLTFLIDLANNEPFESSLKEFQQCALALHARPVPPFKHCEGICTQAAPLCLYRGAAEGLVDGSRYSEWWTKAIIDDEASGSKQAEATWNVARTAAWHLVAFPGEVQIEDCDNSAEAARRAGLCFAQQMLAREHWRHPRQADEIMEALLIAAGVSPADGQMETAGSEEP